MTNIYLVIVLFAQFLQLGRPVVIYFTCLHPHRSQPFRLLKPTMVATAVHSW